MRVLLIEDHPLYGKALTDELREFFPGVVVCEARTVMQAFEEMERQDSFDLILLDLGLPDGGGLKSLLAIHQYAVQIPIIIISANENLNVIESALKSGARGYIPKSANSRVIHSAITLVLDGETYVPSVLLEHSGVNSVVSYATDPGLTDRQRDVLELMARGLSNKLISSELAIAESTVRVHATELFRKLQANNRTEAVLRAQTLGLIGTPGG